MFKLKQVLHCPTNEQLETEDNIYCLQLPDNHPGLLLGLVKVTFSAIPRSSDEFKNEIHIDVGLSKCLSVPIELKIVDPKLLKLNKYLQSEELLLKTNNIFNDVKVQIVDMDKSSISMEDKQLIKKFHEGLKQAKLYSDDCALVLESTDQDFYHEKLHMLLYLEGDYRRQLIRRYLLIYCNDVCR